MFGLSLVAAAGLLLIFIVQRFYNRYQRDAALSTIPTHEFDGDNSDERYRRELKSLLRSGYMKYNKHGQAFKIKQLNGDWRVMLPRDQLPDIKNASENTLSWRQLTRDVFQMDYTGVPQRATWSARSVRMDLTKRLDSITSVMIKEMTDIIESKIPNDASDMTSVNILDLFSAIVAQVTVHVVCGKELAKDSEWVEASAKFVFNAFASIHQIKSYPQWSRYIVSFFLPSIRSNSANRDFAKAKLRPLFADRINAMNDEKRDDPPSDDGFAWLLHAAGNQSASLDELADSMIRIMMASIHTTSQTATACMVYLLKRPELMQELRDEAIEHLAECTPEKIAEASDKLWKMDSFIKEVSRFNPVLTMTAGRKVQKPYICHNGLVLPPNTMIYSATEAIHHDPDIYPDPETFDGLRFYKLRKANPENAKHWLFTAANEENLTFGYGVQSCPGRFFAGREIVLMLSKLVMDYEFDCAGWRDVEPEISRMDNSMVPPKEFTMMCKKRMLEDRRFPDVNLP